MKKSVLFLAMSVAVCAHANPLGKVLLSNIASHPTNVIPGSSAAWQAGDNDVFETLTFSPDRSRWAISGEQEGGTSDLDIVIRGTRSPWSATDVAALEGQATGFFTETWSIIRDGIGIGNDGTVYMGGDTTNATTADDVVMSYNGTLTQVAREGSVVPGTGTNCGVSNNSVHATNDGRIRWATSTIPGAPTGQTIAIFELFGGVGSILSRSGITSPVGQIVPPSQLITGIPLDRVLSAAETNAFFYNATIAGPTSSNVMMVLNNNVILQESQTLTGFGTGVASLSSSLAHTISHNGQFVLSRGALLTSNNDFVVINGVAVAQTDLPVRPGSSELWDDTLYGPTFFASTLNRYGEALIGGTTNNSDIAKNAAVIFTAAGKSYEVMREGDPVDLNGNGTADDNVFISIFDDNTFSVTDGNIAYGAIEIVDGSGTYVGDVILEIYLPLTADADNSGEVDAADIDFVIANFGGSLDAADIDGSGEVDAADIDIVIANFGRTR